MWSQVLDTLIGVVFIFALVSLLASVVVETISTFMQRRAHYLLAGLSAMLDKPAADVSNATTRQVVKLVKENPDSGSQDESPVTLRLFSHPMMRSLQTRQLHGLGRSAVRNPQYVPASTFARALIDTLMPGDEGAEPLRALRTQVSALPATASANDVVALVDGVRPLTTAQATELGNTIAAVDALVDPTKEAVLALVPQGSSDDAFGASIKRVRKAVSDSGSGPKEVCLRALRDLKATAEFVQGRLDGFSAAMTAHTGTGARDAAITWIDHQLPESAQDADVLRLLREGVTNLPQHFPARASLLALLNQAQGGVTRLRTSIEEWYDGQMGRISGWYKRWSVGLLFVIGFAVAVFANVDTMQVGHTLWVDQPVRTAVVAAAGNGTVCRDEGDKTAECVDKKLDELAKAGLPILWQKECLSKQDGWAGCLTTAFSPPNTALAFGLKLLGWVVTGIAVSFGAPFWFDALSKLGNLRIAGTKPSQQEQT